MTKERRQANFRIELEDQKMIQELRQSILSEDGKVPTETAVWRMALADFYDRFKKRKERARDEKCRKATED